MRYCGDISKVHMIKIKQGNLMIDVWNYLVTNYVNARKKKLSATFHDLKKIILKLKTSVTPTTVTTTARAMTTTTTTKIKIIKYLFRWYFVFYSQ